MPHTENAEELPDCPTCTAPTTTTPPVPQNLKTLLLKQQAQAGDVVTCWSSPGQIVRGREIRASCVEPSSTTRAKSREPASPVEGRTELDLVQDEVDEAKRLLEEAQVEVQAAYDKVTEAVPGGTGNGGDGTDQETVGGESGANRSMKMGQKKTSARRHQKDKDHVGKIVRGRQRGRKTTEQQGHHSTVHQFL